MDEMFAGCTALKILKTSEKFNSNSLEEMEKMFKECKSLISLDLSGFTTINVKYMDYAFNNCSSLEYLDVSNFRTNAAFNIKFMFNGCSSLTSLNLAYFDTSKIDDVRLESIFDSCEKLKLTISKKKCSNLLPFIPSYVEVIDIN